MSCIGHKHVRMSQIRARRWDGVSRSELMITPISMDKRPRYSPHSELFGSRQRARQPRCAVVVAHPNDEIVGGGCLISKIDPLMVLHLSDGAPSDQRTLLKAGFNNQREYADARQRESIAALALARVPPEKIFDWKTPWFELSYELVDLTKRTEALLRQMSPQVVLTHAYEGGHPDHDATAFIVHSAVRLLRRSGLKPPLIYEMAIYPGSDGVSRIPEFLFDSARESTTLVLDKPAAELKRRMFQCCETQRDALSETPLGPEKFREAPHYDFRLPPYFGKLHYEKLNWGMTGAEWRSRVRQALKALFTHTASVAHIMPPLQHAMSAS